MMSRTFVVYIEGFVWSVACMLIGSFLDSRSQRVRLNGDYSESVVFTAGREVDSPSLLFAGFINIQCYFLWDKLYCSSLCG
jgi:hypothetical protein